MSIRLIIPGTPIAKARPRFFTKQGRVRSYNIQQTEEGKVLYELNRQFTGPPISSAVEVDMKFFFRRPKYHWGSGRNANKLKPAAPLLCVNNKDVDNLIKFYLDCMNGLVLEDDKQVVKVTGSKAWAHGEAKTIIKIKEVL